MRLTQKVVDIIGEKTDRAKAIRFRLALALSFTDVWIQRCIKANKDNGPLTTFKALNIIQNELGFPQEEILEESAPATA
jgi:hypothetical protein